MPELKRIIIDKRTGFVVDETKIKKTARWRLVLAFLLTALFSLLPDLHMEKFLGMDYSWEFDMAQHGGYYFLLTFVLFWLLPHEKRNVSFFIAIFFISVVFEFLQMLMPGRNFSPLDIASNFLGIAGAFTVRYVLEALKEDQQPLQRR
jgi:VanZ family protein